jgi:hypothetical protein
MQQFRHDACICRDTTCVRRLGAERRNTASDSEVAVVVAPAQPGPSAVTAVTAPAVGSVSGGEVTHRAAVQCCAKPRHVLCRPLSCWMCRRLRLQMSDGSGPSGCGRAHPALVRGGCARWWTWTSSYGGTWLAPERFTWKRPVECVHGAAGSSGCRVRCASSRRSAAAQQLREAGGHHLVAHLIQPLTQRLALLTHLLVSHQCM